MNRNGSHIGEWRRMRIASLAGLLCAGLWTACGGHEQIGTQALVTEVPKVVVFGIDSSAVDIGLDPVDL